jgi:hypothetical protein
MKNVHTFEEFLNEDRKADGSHYPRESAADLLKSLMSDADLKNDAKILQSAVNSINRYNRYKKAGSIMDMNLAFEGDEKYKSSFDMPGALMKKGPSEPLKFWDAYQIGRWNGIPAILLQKDSGAEHTHYVLTVPE